MSSYYSTLIQKRIEFGEMTGTEKQVDWATSIKFDMLKEIENKLSGLAESKPENRDRAIDLFNQVISKLEDIHEARWYIDNRMATMNTLVKTLQIK